MATATARKPRAAKPRYFTGHGLQVVRFAESRIVQTKGRWAGKPLTIEPWQRELFDELYLVDALGKRVYNEALIGLPRKNGKSTMTAAIALHGLIATGEMGPEVYAAAASKDQARIVFQQAREFVEASPKLQDWLKPMRNVITCPANNGVFRVLSSDAPLQHGLNPSLVVIDELWAHANPELYYALTTGVIARLEPLVISITTAGFDRDSICWEVFQRGEALAAKGQAAMRKAGFLHSWIQAPPRAKPSSKRAWMQANPSSWITSKVLEREYERLPEAVFRRLHLNQWTESEDAWISPDEWDRCAGRPRIDLSQPTWMALDVGLTRDASAIVWVQWHGNKLHVKHDIRIPTSGHPLSAADNRARLGRLAGRMEALREVPFDPYAFRESAEMLADEGLPMVQYDQTNAIMCPASQRLYELVREGRVVHNGDETFRRQILAAVATETERGWRISKRKSRERIDACIAFCMAADRAILSQLEGEKWNPEDFRIEQL